MYETFRGISPKADIDPKARLGKNVTVFPFAYIEGDVEIGDDTVIFPGVSVMNGTRLGKNNYVHQNTVLAARPQDFRYKGDETLLIIGDNNVIRENVVINRATFADGQTVIGNKNFIMEGVHISHDVHIGDRCVLGYGTKIAGSVEMDNGIITSTGSILNPQVRIGSAAMIQAGTRISKDVPPYIVAGGNPVAYGGVNSTILKSYGMSDKILDHLANAYRLVFNGQSSVIDVIHEIRQQVPDGTEVRRVVQFLEGTKLGIISKL